MTSANVYSTILTNYQVLQLLALYDNGVSPADAIARTGFDASAVGRWYRKFWRGWAPRFSGFTPTMDSTFYAPVPKRPMSPPNALPWCTPARLTGRRA
jgi:hypothetical protein